jgi:glyceraldehyde-3-phosphate dehydrogenase/erythrose-4-phosphate dehydrogenase
MGDEAVAVTGRGSVRRVLITAPSADAPMVVIGLSEEAMRGQCECVSAVVAMGSARGGML